MAARLPASTPEQRRSLWEDLEVLLYPGFLTKKVVLKGLSVNLRNPNPSDMFLANAYSETGSEEWLVMLLSRCIWMVDGHNILGDRRSLAPVRAVISDLPPMARSALFYALLGLIHRAREAQLSVYSFVYESMSRDLWKSRGARWPVDATLNGVPGSEALGPNHVQMVWAMWNEAEDMRLRDKYDWHIAKNMMACHAPKGVKKIDASDKRNDEKTDRDRQKSLDMHYYQAIGVIDKDGRLTGRDEGDDGDGVVMAHTAAELAEEMRRWVSGEDDWHDQVIRKYKDDIRTGMEEERDRRIAQLEMIRQEAAERSTEMGPGAPALVGYTLAQVREMMTNRGFDLEKPGARKVDYGGDGRNRSYDKWIASEEDAGALVDDGTGILEEGGAIPRPTKDNRSLDEKLAARLPRKPGGGN